jgi:hypothetical protein
VPARAQLVTLTDGNSTAQINTSTLLPNRLGMDFWSVDGINQLYQQWFWFGIGTNAQSTIDTISAPTITPLNAASATISYGNAQLSAQVTYLLTGGVLGSGGAQLNESIHLVNMSGGSLTLRFYQYSDFDLMNNPGGDVLQLGKNVSGKFFEALQSKGGITMSETDITGGGTPPGANHGEASLFPSLVNRLNGPTAVTLADNTTPVGPGDTAWAFEWDVTLAAGASFDIAKSKQISGVPEPGVMSLLGLGFLALAWRKRR